MDDTTAADVPANPDMADILARVRALGRYDGFGEDEDHDRAATYPCNMTFADVEGGALTIYSGPHGSKDGYFDPEAGARVPLDVETMDTILRMLDAGGFPCFDAWEL
jgi:hypothetical protein